MFYPTFVYPSFCLCTKTPTLHKSYLLDLYENFTRDVSVDKEEILEVIHVCIQIY